MKQLLLFVLMAFLWLSASAQKQNVYYLKNNGQQVTVKDSADFIRIIREPDSTSKHYVLIEYYMNGTQKRLGHTSTIDKLTLEGQAADYFPSGKIKRVATYENGRSQGKIFETYPNGKSYRVLEYVTVDKNNTVVNPMKSNIGILHQKTIKCLDSTGKVLAENGNGLCKIYNDEFTEIEAEGGLKNGEKDGEWKGYRKGKDFYTEIFDAGKLVSGVSYDNAGTKYSYTKEAESLPQFKGGTKALASFIQNNFKVPTKTGYKGPVRVEMSFVVDKDGSIIDIVPKNLTLPREFNEEGYRLMKNSPAWTPGKQHGQPVRVAYTLPISISLQ